MLQYKPYLWLKTNMARTNYSLFIEVSLPSGKSLSMPSWVDISPRRKLTFVVVNIPGPTTFRYDYQEPPFDRARTPYITVEIEEPAGNLKGTTTVLHADADSSGDDEEEMVVKD